MSTQQNSTQVSINLLDAMKASQARLSTSTAAPQMGGEDTTVQVKAWRGYGNPFAMQNGSSNTHIVILCEFVSAERPLTFGDYNLSMIEQHRMGINKGSLFIPGGTIQLALSIEDYALLNNKATELGTNSIAFQVKIKDQGKGFIGTTMIGDEAHTIVSFQASEPTVITNSIEDANAYWANNNPSRYPFEVVVDEQDAMYELQLAASETSEVRANMARSNRPVAKGRMVNSTASHQLFQTNTTAGNPPVVNTQEEQDLVAAGHVEEDQF